MTLFIRFLILLSDIFYCVESLPKYPRDVGKDFIAPHSEEPTVENSSSASEESLSLSNESRSLPENQILDPIIRTNDRVPELHLFEGDIVHDAFVDFVFGSRKSSANSVRGISDVTNTSDDAIRVDFDGTPADDVVDNLAFDKYTEPIYSECPSGQTRFIHPIQKRATLAGSDRLWSDAVVFYEFDESISPTKQKIIKSSMSHWEEDTCIRFQPRTTEPDYLSFYNGAGCYTTVGRAGGRQGVSINDGCMFMGTVAHELAHALGFWHEQSRPDRDDSVKIIWENIQPGKEHNFNKMDFSQIDSRGIIYDYNSIMHYGPYSFSINDSLPTIVPKNRSSHEGPITMGQRARLSVLDIEQANRMYCCPVGGCGGSPCVRGRCQEASLPPFYSCTCFSGWYGTNCSTSDNKCALQPCSNGVCRSDNALFGGFQCICNEGYTGLLCDLEIDECEKDPCLNDGQCVDQLGHFRCVCPDRYRGDKCEYLKCPAGMFGCLDRGVCVNETNVCDFNNDCGDWSDEKHICGECSFEDGMCGWENSSDWKWAVNVGSTPSAGTGPDLDHTLKSVAGGYLFVEASELVDAGSRAEISSPVYSFSATSCRMEFAYHMFGAEIGVLLVELVSMRRAGAVDVLFRIEGNQGEYWHLAKIDIEKHFFFQIRIVAVKGLGWRGDVAVDDIVFTGCSTFSRVDNCADNDCLHGQCIDEIGSYSCQCAPGYTGMFCEEDIDECENNTCSDNSVCEDVVDGFICTCAYGYMGHSCSINADYICDLEDGLCEPWKHSDDGDFSWILGVGQTPSKGTGPNADHTSSSTLGHYLYIEGSDPQSEGDRAIIEMGPLSQSNTDCLLSFAYHMRGDTMGSISVLIKYNNLTKEELWVKHGHQGPQWFTDIVPIGSRYKYSIQLVGTIGPFWESDAALDDIMLSGQCGVIDPCIGLQCGEHGRCYGNVQGEYHCYCNSGYEGSQCEHDIDECSGAPCQNGGTCEDLVNGFQCSCSTGFEGRLCEYESDNECTFQPCINGQCVDLVGGYRCTCDPGYIGKHCDIRSCSPSPCLNSGICIQLSRDVFCQCRSMYRGDRCQRSRTQGPGSNSSNGLIDTCGNCEHGVCTTNSTHRTCRCYDNYTGQDCSQFGVTCTTCQDDDVTTISRSRDTTFSYTLLLVQVSLLTILTNCCVVQRYRYL